MRIKPSRCKQIFTYLYSKLFPVKIKNFLSRNGLVFYEIIIKITRYNISLKRCPGDLDDWLEGLVRGGSGQIYLVGVRGGLCSAVGFFFNRYQVEKIINTPIFQHAFGTHFYQQQDQDYIRNRFQIIELYIQSTAGSVFGPQGDLGHRPRVGICNTSTVMKISSPFKNWSKATFCLTLAVVFVFAFVNVAFVLGFTKQVLKKVFKNN